MSRNKREELIRNALKIFYRNGFNATGMDLVAKESGVSKTSIYNHFRTKDELILAVLRLRDENFRDWLFRRMEDLSDTAGGTAADTAAGQLLAMFDALEEWFSEDGYQGCMFVKASAEFQDADNAINRQSYAHKLLVEDHLTHLAETAGFAAPRAIARQLLILKEGAIVLSAMSHDKSPAQDAKEMARQLLGQGSKNC